MGSKSFLVTIGCLVVLTFTGYFVYQDSEQARRIAEEYSTLNEIHRQTLTFEQKKADSDLAKLQAAYEQSGADLAAIARMPAGE